MSRISGKKTAFQGRAKQILIIIADNDGLQHKEIMELMRHKMPTINDDSLRVNVSQYLDELKKEKFVYAAQGASDKRKRFYHLDSAGRAFLDGLQSYSDDDSGRYQPENVKGEGVDGSVSYAEWLGDKRIRENEDIEVVEHRKDDDSIFGLDDDGNLSF